MLQSLWKHRFKEWLWFELPGWRRRGLFDCTNSPIGPYNEIAFELLNPLKGYPIGRVTVSLPQIAEAVNRVAGPSTNPSRDLRRWLRFMKGRQGEWRFTEGGYHMIYEVSLSDQGLEVLVHGNRLDLIGKKLLADG